MKRHFEFRAKISNLCNILISTDRWRLVNESEKIKKKISWLRRNWSQKYLFYRVDLNKDYWGGNTIAGVCLKPRQFACWNWNRRHEIGEAKRRQPDVLSRIDSWLPNVYFGCDPSGGADHYNDPARKPEGEEPSPQNPSWANNSSGLIKIGNHQFYKGPCIYC